MPSLLTNPSVCTATFRRYFILPYVWINFDNFRIRVCILLYPSNDVITSQAFCSIILINCAFIADRYSKVSGYVRSIRLFSVRRIFRNHYRHLPIMDIFIFTLNKLDFFAFAISLTRFDIFSRELTL